MAVEEVAGDAGGDDVLVLLERVEVAVAKLRRDLEADVEELSHAGIVAGIALVVGESTHELLAGPAVDFVGRVGGFADVIGDIEGEEIAGYDEAIDGAEVDVVGIEKIKGPVQPRSATALSAASRVVWGSGPMMSCSRLD